MGSASRTQKEHAAIEMDKSVHTDDQRIFREVMTATRKKAGLTQSDLAERLGKPQSFVAEVREW